MDRVMVAPTILCTALLTFATGCIESEQRQVLTFEADGSLTWVAWEEGARSTLQTLAERQVEEETYLESVRAGRTDLAKALASLEPLDVLTSVLRDRAPFTVMTEARFEDPGAALQRLLDEACLPGEAVLEGDGERRLLTIVVADVDEGACADEPPARALLANGLVLVLPEGTITEAVGYEQAKPGVAILRLDGDHAPPEADGVRTWTLEWTTQR